MKKYPNLLKNDSDKNIPYMDLNTSSAIVWALSSSSDPLSITERHRTPCELTEPVEDVYIAVKNS